MKPLKKLIAEVIGKKQGNKEFALFYMESGIEPLWWAEIGNPSKHVCLGESSGEIDGKGDTPEEAVADLLRKVEEHNAQTVSRAL